MNTLVCALTGHRNLPEGFDKNMLFYSLERLIKEGYTTFLCGMACGFDLLALECLVELKQRYHVRIKACIPYPGQENRFPDGERKKYRRLLDWCDEKTVLYEAYFPGCFLARNRYMVEGCDLLFAYLTQKSGGTAYTVKYAESCGVPVRYLET